MSAQLEKTPGARARIAELLADKLDSQHVSEERRDFCAAEDAADLQFFTPEPAASDRQSRHMFLQLLLEVTRSTGAPLSCWFQAARLLDSNAAQRDCPSVSEALARTAATWLFCLKADKELEPHVYRYIADMVAKRASSVCAHLGHAPVTEAMLVREMRGLLGAQALKLSLPSLSSWLTMIWTRLDIATGSSTRSTALLTLWAEPLMIGSILQGPASAKSPPLQRAAGIAALAQVVTGVLPRSAICPADAEPKWLQSALAFVSATPHAAKLSTEGASPGLTADVMTAALEFASGLPFLSIRTGALEALEMVYTHLQAYVERTAHHTL